MILEIAVVPVPDEIAGEEIILSVLFKQGNELSTSELEKWLMEHLFTHMMLRFIDVRDII
jgi:crotonobetaine/carnitine-CoA ligase